MKKTLKIFSLFFIIVFISFRIYLQFNYTPPILMYHSLDGQITDTYAAVNPIVFEKQMDFIKKHNYNVILLDDYCQLLSEKKDIPGNSVIITFDDGYKNNLKAIEILHRFHFPATIFLIVNKIGEKEYLSSDDISYFLKNTEVRIGSHTIDHAYLPSLDDKQLETEIRESKQKLEQLFSQKVLTIAYPIGGFNQKVLEKVNESDYLCACSTNKGFSRQTDRFALRRVKMTETDNILKLWAKLSGFYNVFRKLKNPD